MLVEFHFHHRQKSNYKINIARATLSLLSLPFTTLPFVFFRRPAFFSHSQVQKNFINSRHFSGELTEPHSPSLACLFAPAAASSANNIARRSLVFQFNAVPSPPHQRCSATSSRRQNGRALQRDWEIVNLRTGKKEFLLFLRDTIKQVALAPGKKIYTTSLCFFLVTLSQRECILKLF